MKSLFWISAFALMPWCALESVANPHPPLTVILDPGHTPKQGGATSIRGIKEVDYNDALSAMLADSLRAHGIRVLTTRRNEEEITLQDRVAVARINKADCFLSLHHDSAQPKYLKKENRDGVEAFSTIIPIRGYSLFVSSKNGDFQKSLDLAKHLGQSLLTLGRKPTWHHSEPIQGENRPLLDSTLGIYRFDDLTVLAKNPIPAVLIEYGVIVDSTDEAYVSDRSNQARFSLAIVEALRHSFQK